MNPPGPDGKRDTLALRHDRPGGPFLLIPARWRCAALTLAFGAGLMLTLTSAMAESDTIRGTPEVLDGHRMVVAGREIVLADIHAPEPGESCRIRGNPLDCGILARAGLMDIVAGSEVACVAVGGGQHRCFADRYDVGFGLIHAGWALPSRNAPAHYKARMTEAEEHGRGLWSARPETGEEPSLAHRLRP